MGSVVLLSKSKNILVYVVNDVKVDFVNYDYRWVKPVLNIQGFRLASKEDIVAMKLNAIAGRGSKKDFIDLFFLLKQFSLGELLDFYKSKYPDGSEFMVLKSLGYFDDADEDETPNMLLPMNWEQVKIHIAQQLKEYFN